MPHWHGFESRQQLGGGFETYSGCLITLGCISIKAVLIRGNRAWGSKIANLKRMELKINNSNGNNNGLCSVAFLLQTLYLNLLSKHSHPPTHTLTHLLSLICAHTHPFSLYLLHTHTHTHTKTHTHIYTCT